ncbi:hypothetical protein BD847_3204 [Flavobacterium cutihirudinis]|uniref:Uncharacterized protein n=1 Tax=Flavobacterium cutihirudinis TaxID=1265740 RepID=A0A3D9FQ41_9FLAO|nr:hypothetical protein [Flavobacterium cutihirudinis]RED22574.1 hypothetical protein BD847_3204 [Flavobacterium cutihirudinis]
MHSPKIKLIKKVLFVSILMLFVIYALREIVYKPYMWQKAMHTPEHRLQMGSFVFSKQDVSSSTQSGNYNYLIFKVIEINGDYVRLSPVRKLLEKKQPKTSDSSFTRETYRSLKLNINKLEVAGIHHEDLHKIKTNFTLNDYLLEKYPSLKKSQYYYEEVSPNEKNINIPSKYFKLVYSKEKIIEKRKLIPYRITDSETPELAKELSQKASFILN